MNSTSQSNGKTREIALWVSIALVTFLAIIFAYYYHVSGPVKAMVWIGWFLFVSVLGFFTSKGKELCDFALEARTELEKVVWPARQETIQITSIVMLMVGVTGLVLWVVDSGMMWAIGKITHLG